ncbi:hypothetical protein M9Y10_004726 [Tritrichomonas musculus]|uniref:Beige/BEACH domain containing protein n=1 Tax=Tritrichomonas musculus TaxID=1915356 RepID=A0ABR2JJF0_9EUKA
MFSNFRQAKGFAISERTFQLWIQYFTQSTPKSLASIPKSSPLNAHYSNFNFTDFNPKILFAQKAAIESNPSEALPVMLHLDQPISPHYFKFCLTIDTLNLDTNLRSKIAQEVGPQIIRSLVAFTFQLQLRLSDILNKKENAFFPSRFIAEFKYFIKFMLSSTGKIFADFLYLLDPVFKIFSSVDDQSSIVYQSSIDIITVFVPFLKVQKIKIDELKQVVSFVSVVFTKCTTQDSLFSEFCTAITTNTDLFPFCFSEQAYSDFVLAVANALDRISSQPPSNAKFEVGLSYLKSIIKTIYRQKKIFDIVPHILTFLEWSLKLTKLPKFELPKINDKKLFTSKSQRKLFEFTSLDLFDDSPDECKKIEVKKLHATYITTSSILAKTCGLISQLCFRDENITESVIVEFPKKGPEYVYFAVASVFTCPPDKILSLICKTNTFQYYFSREIINEYTLLETSKNQYLINLKNLLLALLIEAHSPEVPAILSKVLDLNHPIAVFKIVQIYNILISDSFVEIFARGSSFDVLMRIYESYKTYLIDNEPLIAKEENSAEAEENKIIKYMKKSKSEILKFIVSFMDSEEASSYIIGNGTRIDFILSLLFENKSFDIAINILCKSLQYQKIGLLLSHINSLIKSGFDHLEMNEWRELYSLLIDCISAAIITNRSNVVKKFISSGSISIFSRIPIAFQHVKDSKEAVLRFLNKILQFFSTLCSGSFRMIKELSNPQWNFVPNMISAIEYVDITNEIIDLLTYFTTIGDTLWITTGIELLFVASEKDNIREKILKMLVEYVESNVANRYQCYIANTLSYLLDSIEKNPCELTFNLFSLIGSTFFRMRELSLTLRLLSKSSIELSIQLLKVLIQIAEKPDSSEIPKSFLHFTTQNSFLIDSFTIPQTFSIATNAYFPFDLKKKKVFFKLQADNQMIMLWIMDNKFFLDIQNYKKSNSFQLCTNLKSNVWYKISLSITPSNVSFYLNSNLVTSSVIPSKFKFLNPVTFSIEDIKCDLEYIQINSKDYSFYSDFNGKCVNEGICANTCIQSPIKKANFDGLAVPYIVSFINSIPNCGGPRIFLPLFEKVESEEYLKCLLRLINAIATRNESMFIETQFFRALAYHFLNIKSELITNEIIEMLYSIYKTFSNEDIKIEMLSHIFGNFSIWKKVTKENQLMLYSGIFTSIFQYDSSLFNEILRFDELLLKFTLMYENSDSSDELMQKTTNFLLMMSQNKFTEHDAQILIGSLMQITSNEMCLNSIILTINILIDKNKELLKELQKVNYFKPFVVVLNSRFEKTRIISMHSLFYLQSLLKTEGTLMSLEMIDSIRLWNILDTSNLSMINLISYMTNSINYKDFPRVNTTFDFDNVMPILYPQFLPLFTAIISLVPEIKSQSLKYILNSYEKYDESRRIAHLCKFWILYFIFFSILDDENKEEWMNVIGLIFLSNENINDNLYEILYFSLLLGKPLFEFIKPAILLQFKQNQTVEMAILIIRLSLYDLETNVYEECKEDEIHSFAQKILLSKSPVTHFNYIKNDKNSKEKNEVNDQLAKDLTVVTKFLIQQGVEFLFESTIIPDTLNFTVICFIIDLIGCNQEPTDGIKDNEALFHLLTPYIENLDNQLMLEKGLTILIGGLSKMEGEIDELIKILKKIDPIFAPASNDEIIGTFQANKDEFNEDLNELSISINNIFDEKLNNVHNSVSEELSRIFNGDSEILSDLRVKFSKELYEVQQDTERTLRKNYNFWKTIKKELSLQNGGPWFSIPKDPHYKFDNILDSIGRRNKLVLNKKFNDHADAAWESPQNEEIEEEEESPHKKKVKAANILYKNEVESPNVYSIQLECQMVTVLNNFKGTMYVSKTSIYFEAKETTDAFGDILNKTSKLIEIQNKDIKFILKRRYLCIDSGAEIFTIYNRSFYFTFGSDSHRTEFFKEIEKMKPANLEFIQFGDASKAYNDLKLRKRWAEGEMSNYEYLWWLNALSGRSIHDISQYPVYPWVIKDYRSRTLDLSNKDIYRDLSKPIGALNEERLKQIRFLYQETKDTPFACLYRFHYSTPAYVILFLLRKEPFTTLHIQLQNNKFDHPNRLFFSIAAAWDSVTTNTSDFRELIPEFFATPDFLLNSDGYNLGTRFDFVQLKKSLSFGTVSELDNQNVSKSSSLTSLNKSSDTPKKTVDDSILESDETFTSLLNPEMNKSTQDSDQQLNKEVSINQGTEIINQPQEQATETNDNSQLGLKPNDSITDSDLLNNTSSVNATKASSTSKLVHEKQTEDQRDSCIVEDNHDLDPANFKDDGEKKQEITIPYISNGKVNLSKAELGLTNSPSSNNFVGIKIVKTKKGQLVRRDFKVDDIELPLWAPSAAAFVAINRLALESEYVSSNLHKWIDLIFGVKQRSEEADNIFHPFSYVQKEPKDPNELQTLQQHAANFGMVPQCLFTTLHPYRKFKPRPHAFQSMKCTSNISNNNGEISVSLFFEVSQIQKFDENILKISSSSGSFSGIFEKDSTFRTFNVTSLNNNITNSDTDSNNNLNSSFSKSSFESIENNGNEVHLDFVKNTQIEISAQLTPQRIFITNGSTLVISPPWSQSFSTLDMNTMKKWSPNIKDAHSASVKVIACDIESGVVVTAAEDSSLFVWDIKNKRKISTIVAHADQIMSVAISSELEVVASCDQSGELIFSSMKTGNFIFKKKLCFHSDASIGIRTAPKKILLSTLGFVVLIYDCIEEDTSHSTRISLIDMSGRFLNELKLEGKFTSSIIIKNQDFSEYLVIAQETKLIYILRIFDLKIVCFGPVTGAIKDMCFSKDDLSLYFLTKENELLLSKFCI